MAGNNFVHNSLPGMHPSTAPYGKSTVSVEGTENMPTGYPIGPRADVVPMGNGANLLNSQGVSRSQSTPYMPQQPLQTNGHFNTPQTNIGNARPQLPPLEHPPPGDGPSRPNGPSTQLRPSMLPSGARPPYEVTPVRSPMHPDKGYHPPPRPEQLNTGYGPPNISLNAPRISAPPDSNQQNGPMISNHLTSTSMTAVGAARPWELPVPFQGQGTYGRTVNANSLSTPITPGSSEPGSKRSSAAASPITAQQYDALEGQFTPQPTAVMPNFPANGSGLQAQPTSQPLFSSSAPPAPQSAPIHGPRSGIEVAPGSGRPFQGGPVPGHLPANVRTHTPDVVSAAPHPGPANNFPAPPAMRPPNHQDLATGMSNLHMRPPVSQPRAGMMPPRGPPPPGHVGMPPPPMSSSSSATLPPPKADALKPSTGVPPQMPGGPPTSFPSGPPPNMGAAPPSGAPANSGVPPHIAHATGTPFGASSAMATHVAPTASTAQSGGQPGSGAAGRRQYPGAPPAAAGYPVPPTSYASSGSGQNHIPQNAPLSSSFNAMKSQEMRPVNLLQERTLIPADGMETPKPGPEGYKKVNCDPEVFRCTLGAIPQTQALLTKARLPLGILIHPFKDLSTNSDEDEVDNDKVDKDEQLPVIQSSVIVRCRSCRTYINPFVAFVDMRRWKCNLCFRVNELPDEFSYDPLTKSYGEPQRRPEIKSATIEFIAPSEYMLRPPQPAVYLFVIDVSFNAVNTGYLDVFCQTMIDEMDRLPGDSRTHVGFIAFDRSLYFFNLAEGLSQPQMLIMSDIDVNMQESKDLVINLLNQLPRLFQGNTETGCAYGSALQAAFKLMGPTGGRVSTFLTQLPSCGPGALKSREDPNERASKKIQNLGPATDFYKKLSLDCSAQQIALDVFLLNSQYADLATVAGTAKYSGGCVHYYPSFHAANQPAEAERFENDLRRYLTRKIGLEAVMRIRCTRGLSIHTFHGNFFVRSTDLLSLPNINPDAGFGMQMSIEDSLADNATVCFQAALLYTSSKGERRIRVHTLCLPVTNSLSEIFQCADQLAIVGLLAKMAADRTLTSSIGDARDAMLNSVVDMVTSYAGSQLSNSQRAGGLYLPYSLRTVPLFVSALLKSVAFRIGHSTRLDERIAALESCKTQPLAYMLMSIYPHLYPIHALDDKKLLNDDEEDVVAMPPRLQLSSANLTRQGAYLLDTGVHFYIWIGGSVSPIWSKEVLDAHNFADIPENMTELPDLENDTAERVRSFLGQLNDQRPFPAPTIIIREDSRLRNTFLQYMIEDRTESSLSYYEFLQHVQKEVKG